jgi:glutamyl-tRNA synthetase
MGVTHVIRGDDHLTNAFKQKLIYQAMGWSVPEFAHIPLIHGADGAKLSKRHGALGVEEYEKMGYLPEAMRNYLLRLGWAHGDDEIISTGQAIAWFGLEGAGKSPSRFDFMKLENLNGHYIREAGDERLTELVCARIGAVDELGKARILKGMNGLKQRAKTLKELAENAIFYTLSAPIPLDDKARETLEKGSATVIDLVPLLEAAGEWSQAPLEQIAREYAEKAGQKLGNVAQPLRAALTGKTVSPGVFEVMEVLGKEETLKRLKGR